MKIALFRMKKTSQQSIKCKKLKNATDITKFRKIFFHCV